MLKIKSFRGSEVLYFSYGFVESDGVLQVLSTRYKEAFPHIFFPPIGNLKENSPTGKFTTTNKKAHPTECISGLDKTLINVAR